MKTGLTVRGRCVHVLTPQEVCALISKEMLSCFLVLENKLYKCNIPDKSLQRLQQ